MIVVMNRIPIAPGFGDTFEERFHKRAELIDHEPGFIRNEICGRFRATITSSRPIGAAERILSAGCTTNRFARHTPTVRLLQCAQGRVFWKFTKSCNKSARL